MAELRSFNPMAAFSRGRSNALALQGQATRNQQQQFNLDTEQGVRKRTQADQSLEVLGNVAEGLLNVPRQNRAAAVESLQQVMNANNIPEGSFTEDKLTDEYLTSLSEASKKFRANPEALTAAMKEHNFFTKGFSEEDDEKVRRIKTRIDPPAVGSSAQTITELDIAPEISETESIISEGKEGGKLKAQEAYLPRIRGAIELAESKAKTEGESFTDFQRMEAGMPGLVEAVSDLRELAPIATSTLGGRVWDVAVQQTGFGATEGGTARSQYISIIDNQVLPLLRETFGSQFTEKEGTSLKATLGDPNNTVEAKIAILDSFIKQKERNIRKEEEFARRLKADREGKTKEPGQDFSELSDEQLLSF